MVQSVLQVKVLHWFVCDGRKGMSNLEQARASLDGKTPLIGRMSFFLTDFCGNLLFCIIGSYLLYFYTDVFGLPVTVTGMLQVWSQPSFLLMAGRTFCLNHVADLHHPKLPFGYWQDRLRCLYLSVSRYRLFGRADCHYLDSAKPDL